MGSLYHTVSLPNCRIGKILKYIFYLALALLLASCITSNNKEVVEGSDIVLEEIGGDNPDLAEKLGRCGYYHLKVAEALKRAGRNGPAIDANLRGTLYLADLEKRIGKEQSAKTLMQYLKYDEKIFKKNSHKFCKEFAVEYARLQGLTMKERPKVKRKRSNAEHYKFSDPVMDFSNCKDEASVVREAIKKRITRAKKCVADEDCMTIDLPYQFGGCGVGLNLYTSDGIMNQARGYVNLHCKRIKQRCYPPTYQGCVDNKCRSNGDIIEDGGN
jgi:hypothetical protein